MFSISSSNCCCDRLAVPYGGASASRGRRRAARRRAWHATLKARCSRKWAVPLVSSVSAREPASIHMPTVDVWAHGECSVATCAGGGSARRRGRRGSALAAVLTVRPFLSVVVCVLPIEDGVAKPRRRAPTAAQPARRRRPCERFKASLRDAMARAFGARGGGGGVLSGLKEMFRCRPASRSFPEVIGDWWPEVPGADFLPLIPARPEA